MVGRKAPVGKTNLQDGKRRGIVVDVWPEEDVNVVERRGAANSGPLVEVPCKKMRVSLCVAEDLGRIVYGSGYSGSSIVNLV